MYYVKQHIKNNKIYEQKQGYRLKFCKQNIYRTGPIKLPAHLNILNTYMLGKECLQVEAKMS